jgi:hypothetical protein
MNDTLRDLRTALRYRLNDADSGNYTDAELLQCINTAVHDTELTTRCHIDTLATTGAGIIESIAETPVAGGTGYEVGDILTLATGTGGTAEVIQTGVAGVVVRVKLLTRGTGYTAATTYATTSSPSSGRSNCTIRVNAIRAALVIGTAVYDYGPIFEPIEVSLHWTTSPGGVVTDEILTFKSIKDLQSDSDYNIVASSKPATWSNYSGSQLLLSPAPNHAAAASDYLRIRGYAVSADLVSDYDRPVSIPEGYRVLCILDRAEAEARKMRLTTTPNTALYVDLMNKWSGWCESIISSLKGDGR